MIFSIINFISLTISLFLLSYIGLLSIQPVKRSYKFGDKAWTDCKNFRSISGIFELISVINLILWIWFPLPLVDSWIISQNIWLGIIIAICIAIPCSIILFKGLKDAGSESLNPSKDTEMFGGIYNHIRHPQTIGELPYYVALGFAINSWFLVSLMAAFLVIFIPINIYYEEKDLIRRFGDKYQNYRKQTGALFPKLRKKKE